MKRQLNVTQLMPTRLLIVSVFCLLSMFLNVTETVAEENKSETALPGYSLSLAHFDVAAGSDTLALPYSEPVHEPDLKTGGEFEKMFTRCRLGYQTFTNESMSDSYGPVYIGSFEFVGWGERFGVSFDTGLLGCEGTPPLIDSDWIVSDSWLTMTTISIGLNALYSFTDTTDPGFFKPYVGLGPALWFGWERIAVDASNNSIGIEEEFYAELLGLGFSYGGCAMIGTTLRITEKFSALVEVRGILSSSGGIGDLIEEEDKPNFDSSLYSVVERPDFNFTGWRIDVGIQW